MIGAQPGGGFDIYGRVVARHIGRHIPGNPTVIPKNMPGAGGARAAGFLAKIAPKDGTVIANIMPGAVIGPLLDPKAEKLFNPTEVMYIGNVNNGVQSIQASVTIQNDPSLTTLNINNSADTVARLTRP